jgi:ribosomal protein S14
MSTMGHTTIKEYSVWSNELAELVRGNFLGVGMEQIPKDMEKLNIRIHDIVSGCLDDHPQCVNFRPRCYLGVEGVYISNLEIDDELLPSRTTPNIEEGKEVVSELFPSSDVHGKECQPVYLNCAQSALRTVRPQSYYSLACSLDKDSKVNVGNCFQCSSYRAMVRKFGKCRLL